jgi:two-component system LytT family response regulator
MLNSLLIDNEPETLTTLKKLLSIHCPQIDVRGQAQSWIRASSLIAETDPELVFFNVAMLTKNGLGIVEKLSSVDYEVIVVSECMDHVMDAIKCSAAGYIVKPIKKEDLIPAVKNAQGRIAKRAEYLANKLMIERLSRKSNKQNIVGIPTIEGFEFIPINDILRLEGLQKCTRVITKDKSDIISSYNIGEFRKILEDYSFFSPHKSHLINLSHIRKYHKEGSIMMVDGSFVPVAKRKKKDFLDQITHV